jgi:hypothetical protein
MCVPSCGDAIRLLVLLHHDLSAPVSVDTLHSVWYASNVTHYRTFLPNDNDVCFTSFFMLIVSVAVMPSYSVHNAG